jgi:RNA polymerase sigma factor (sigma-70 family)
LNDCRDKELVSRLHKGDVKAFDTLYLKYHQALYSNIHKLTKNTDATKDILQEVFISLWEKRLTIDGNRPISNWLFTVSYNRSINYLKTVLRESLKLTDLNSGLNLADEKETNRREIQLSLIENAVRHLSPQRSKVFDLCKIQGKSYDETAKELNISKHTVKEYLVDAVVNIKEHIQKHPESSTAFFCAALLS